MPDHRFATSAEVHEPKHITNTTTADSGKVITPSISTDGESELRYLSFSDLSDSDTITPAELGIRYAFIELSLDENTSSISTAAATDPDLYTASDYIKITSSILPGATTDQIENFTFNSSDYTAVASVPGIYKANAWFNVYSDTANTKVGLKFTINGVPTGSVVKTDLAQSGKVQQLTASFLGTISENDQIGVSVATDKSVALTISDFNVVFDLIKES